MRATATPATTRSGKRRLLESCAITAGLMALAYGGPALAQVAGTGTIVTGGVGSTINNNAGTNTTTVNVTANQTIINWVPTDTATTGGAIDFLPTGENWNFTGSGSYIVLNRFVNGGGGSLSRQIALNGTVNSVDFATSGGRGGNIWFYNAGGILIGATGVINVGSLVLTANDIDTTGGLSPGGTIRFRGASGSTSSVTVAAGAAINANNAFDPGSSYVALVAPRIVQAGAVRVDGSVGYVAAEQADIRINSGLFDINVLVGAEGGNAITHTGSTTGPAHQQGDTDQSRIYMVAIPKNVAVTMLVSGQVGYDAVTAQTDPNGAVRLSAGYNITNGELNAAPANTTAANITVNDALFLSSVFARASGNFFAQALQQVPPPSPSALPPPHLGRILVQGDGTFIGDATARIDVNAGQIVGATGNLTVQSGGTNGLAGASQLNLNGGQLGVGGDLIVSANGAANAATGNAQGGTALFRQTGGTAVIGNLTVSAGALGGIAAGTSGTGIGGTATIDLLGGTINVADIVASASGVGGVGQTGSDLNPPDPVVGGNGGFGQGGTATINIAAGATVNAATINASALGQGGTGGSYEPFFFAAAPGTPGNGGNGQGGNAAVNITGGTVNTTDIIADASGIGGEGGASFSSSSSGAVTGMGVGGTGGNGRGGRASIPLAAAVNVTGSIIARAQGFGGNGGRHNVGGNGGDGFGGVAEAIVNNFNVGALAIRLDASATGGSGADGRDGNGGNGGAATGGTTRFQLEGANARVTVRATNFRTEGEGGAGGSAQLGFGGDAALPPVGGNGGNGTGGTVEVVANGGIATIVPAGIFDVGVPFPASLGSGGTGGDGGNGAGTSQRGGAGGNGGNGSGGGVRLIANGGTITTNGGAIDLVAIGAAGAGGLGGDGQIGMGLTGTAGQTGGGIVRLESSATGGVAGQINFGVTRIAVNGATAGRIELQTGSGGSILMTSLTAQALGTALPTDNDTDEAPAGIFFAPTGGSISTTGDMTLTTDSSFGTYARSNGIVTVGGNLTINAGDQIDIRHDLREGAAPTIAAVGNLTASAGSISGAPGSLLDAGATLSLTSTVGGIAIDRLDANDIVMTAAGAASVEHAEATNDFTASGASFRTGLNSIITGGDILITSPGAVDLGNTTAGGFVQVNGQSILFSNIDAGASVSLTASGNAVGADGISGGSIDAGGNINLTATRIAIGGTITGGGSLFAIGSAGPVAINLATIADDISVFARGDLTGTYNAVGNIRLNSGANINASANATGFESSSSGPPIAASVFADATGNIALANSSATGMFGVNAGGSASLSGVNAGEDILVLAGTTATLTNLTAGDDVTAIAAGGIIANGLTTTGLGPDNRTLIYRPISPASPAGFQINASAPDGSNIALTASAGNIGGGDLSAFDNLLITASGAVTTTGTLESGLATRIDGDSISFAAIDAGTTVDLLATNAIIGADIAAGGDINLNGDSIALSGAVTGDASFFAIGSGGAVAVNQATVDGTISIFAAGDLTGTYVAGGDVFLNSGANIDASATANGGFVNANGVGTQGNVFVDAAGNVVLTNSAAARMFGVNAGGSATITDAGAGEDMLLIAGTTATLTNVTAGDDVDVRATGNISAANVRATGAGNDTRILSYVAGNGFTISQGEGLSATNGSDIFLTAGGSIDAAALSASDDITAIAPGRIALNGATTLGLGITGGASDIRTQGGDTTLAGLNAFTDVVIASTGTANATGPVAAGRDVTINANNVTLVDIVSSGQVLDTITAGRNIGVGSATGITGGALSAGGSVALVAGGAIAITQAESGDGAQMTLTGATGIDAETLTSRGVTTLSADNGTVRVGSLSSLGDVSVIANSLDIGTNGPVTFASIITDVGDATIRSGNRLIVDNANIAGTARFSNSGEHMIIRNLTAAAADFDANEMISMTSVSVTGDLNADAGGTIFIDGVVTGRNISLASADIDLVATGRVGTAGTTQALSFINNNSDNQTFVGGTGSRNGYHIDAAELTRAFGSDIEIFAPEVDAVGGGSVGTTAPPDVIVDTFTLAGGAAGSNLGANGSLTITTPGKMRVLGNVLLTGLSDTNALNLFADEAIEVILGQGTVRLVNGSNAAGQLNMVSDDIIVATTAAIGAVGTATATDAIEARLAQNDGVLLDEGSLFARGIRADVIGGFYVQNSGSGTEFANRRGLTFGAGGLNVLTEGSGSRIVINGVQLGAAGQVTGLDTIPLLTIGGSAPSAGGFDPRSTFNGCLIGNVASCSAVSFDFENNFPVQDVIEEEADAEDEDGNGQSLPVPLITMRDLDPLSGEPLLDDPVTGAGNDDLWTPTEQP
ncbi:hypothetical protein [Sphingopyxis sp.]|uniref:hypothetical protein n=1 Tax=Sphingopyxis sp. TaxID=1908224 RepID=UPI003D13CDDA